MALHPKTNHFKLSLGSIPVISITDGVTFDRLHTFGAFSSEVGTTKIVGADNKETTYSTGTVMATESEAEMLMDDSAQNQLMEAWHDAVKSGVYGYDLDGIPKTLSMLAEDGKTLLAQWMFGQIFPSKIATPSLSKATGEVGKMSITFQISGVQRIL